MVYNKRKSRILIAFSNSFFRIHVTWRRGTSIFRTFYFVFTAFHNCWKAPKWQTRTYLYKPIVWYTLKHKINEVKQNSGYFTEPFYEFFYTFFFKSWLRQATLLTAFTSNHTLHKLSVDYVLLFSINAKGYFCLS